MRVMSLIIIPSLMSTGFSAQFFFAPPLASASFGSLLYINAPAPTESTNHGATTITQGVKKVVKTYWSHRLWSWKTRARAKNEAPASALRRAHLPHSASSAFAVAVVARAPLDDPARNNASPDYGGAHAAHLKGPRSAPQATRQETSGSRGRPAQRDGRGTKRASSPMARRGGVST